MKSEKEIKSRIEDEIRVLHRIYDNAKLDNNHIVQFETLAKLVTLQELILYIGV